HPPPVHHPFPTRRSSDLRRQGLADAFVAEVDERQLGLQGEQLKAADGFFLFVLESEGRGALALFEDSEDTAEQVQLGLVGFALLDRKSTRLNSSHVAISY